MTGHRVVIEAWLNTADEDGLRAPVVEGHRSIAYGFDSLDPCGAPMFFGALVESVRQGGEPGATIVAVIRFYHDLAELYATCGARFDVDYGRVVGTGAVVEVLPPFEETLKVRAKRHPPMMRIVRFSRCRRRPDPAVKSRGSSHAIQRTDASLPIRSDRCVCCPF